MSGAEQQIERKKQKYSVAPNYILLCHTEHYNVQKAHKMLDIEGYQ